MGYLFHAVVFVVRRLYDRIDGSVFCSASRLFPDCCGQSGIIMGSTLNLNLIV